MRLKHVNKMVLGLIFCILLITLLAHPAPQSLEMADVLLIILPFLLAIVCLAVSTPYAVGKLECDLVLAILFYCGYLTVSVLVGMMHGVPLLQILRASGPYLDFMPLLALCLLPRRIISPWQVAALLILIGLMQAGFQFYLYFTHAIDMVDTQSVLRGRITLINPRATLPIILALTILPFAFYTKPRMKYPAICLILIGLFGAMVTLTRSILLSILMGWLLFFLLQFVYERYPLRFSLSTLAFILLFALISLIPEIQMMEQGLLARFYSAASSKASDYSNGRLYDEWIPALLAWLNADTLSVFFGIGAGNTFTIASGEERTYVHNLLIYTLVYGGLAGFLSCLLLYVTTFKTLVRRAFETSEVIYLALAALLGSLFCYGQLFAVHKGLAFNAMLFLLITMALCKDENDVRN